MGQIGRSVRRLEDRPLLTGAGRFAADIAVPGMVWMRVVRSPVAFGRLAGIRTEAALAHPAAITVWTAADVAEVPLNPLGVKGAGEAGINAVGAAIAAAIDDALGRPGAVRELPLTPARLDALLSEFPETP